MNIVPCASCDKWDPHVDDLSPEECEKLNLERIKDNCGRWLCNDGACPHYPMEHSKEDRLNPKNKHHARLLFIEDGDCGCDICDEKGPIAVITTLSNSINLDICKKCLEEIIKRFDE